jgi:hypothetical protein
MKQVELTGREAAGAPASLAAELSALASAGDGSRLSLIVLHRIFAFA